ncbi:Protein 21.1 [Giardia lamblia P15]|uniref:Protein 21.1 n=1 Tax=Giardia intestinalis (strain P15) TaxID=658858 RepID=E1EYS2_GIAIA|nr:Protein 21.1 [Giardia lamblia P15]
MASHGDLRSSKDGSANGKREGHLLQPGIYWDLLRELMLVTLRIVLPWLNTPHEDINTDTFLQFLRSCKRIHSEWQNTPSPKPSLLSEVTILEFLIAACDVVLEFDYCSNRRPLDSTVQLFRRADRRFRPPDLTTYHSDPPLLGVWALGCISYEFSFLQQVSATLLKEYYSSTPITNTQELIRRCLAANPQERISAATLRDKAAQVLAAEKRVSLFLTPTKQKSLINQIDTSNDPPPLKDACTNISSNLIIRENPYIFPTGCSEPREATPLAVGARSPLIEAVRKADLKQLKNLIDTGHIYQHLRQYDVETGKTALMIAAETGSEEIVEKLLTLKCTTSKFTSVPTNCAEETRIIMHLDRWSEQRHQFLVQCRGYRPVTEEKLAALMELGQTTGLFCALSLAMKAGHWSCVKQLAQYEVGLAGFTPLMAAAVSGDSNLIMQSLQYLNFQCEGITAAMLAALYGNVKCLEIILSALVSNVSSVSTNSDCQENELPLELSSITSKETGNLNVAMLAILTGHPESVQTLLFRVPSIARHQNTMGQTALMLAAAKGYDTLVTMMLPYESDLFDGYGQTVVSYAAGSTSYGPGSVACLSTVADYFLENCCITDIIHNTIRRSITHIDVHDPLISEQAGKTDCLGRCALMYAIETHNTTLVSSLLAIEASMPYKRKKNSLQSENEEIVSSNIIDYALDIKAYIVLPTICAYYAANPTIFLRSLPCSKRNGLYGSEQTELMKVVEEHGLHAEHISGEYLKDCCKVSALRRGLMSALALAASNSDIESVLPLLRELCIQLSPCKPALYYAIRAQNVSCANLLLAEVHLWGGTYLMAYAALGNTTAVEQLIKLNYGIRSYSEKGWTALMFAARYGHTSCAKLLLEYEGGMVTNERYKSGIGVSALMIAIWHNHLGCVQVLCSRERDIKTKDGRKAVDIAREENRRNLVSILL